MFESTCFSASVGAATPILIGNDYIYRTLYTWQISLVNVKEKVTTFWTGLAPYTAKSQLVVQASQLDGASPQIDWVWELGPGNLL